MSKVKTTSQIVTYGESTKPDIKIHSHWNSNNYIVLQIGDLEITIAVNELRIAINNCTNVGY